MLTTDSTFNRLAKRYGELLNQPGMTTQEALRLAAYEPFKMELEHKIKLSAILALVFELTSKSELEGILLTFILDKFKYEVGIADNIRLRDCILDGRDFYLNISSDKTKIKLTVIYQKSEPRIKRSCLPQIQPSTD